MLSYDSIAARWKSRVRTWKSGRAAWKSIHVNQWVREVCVQSLGALRPV